MSIRKANEHAQGKDDVNEITRINERGTYK